MPILGAGEKVTANLSDKLEVTFLMLLKGLLRPEKLCEAFLAFTMSSKVI